MTDVRLALATGAAWLVLALSLARSLVAVLIIAALAGGAGAVGLAARSWPWRRVSAVGPAVAAAGFCIALVLVPFAGRLWQARASPLVLLAEQRAAVIAELTVSGDPHLLAATGTAGGPRVSVETDTVRPGRRRSQLDAVWAAPGAGARSAVARRVARPTGADRRHAATVS